MVFMKIHLRFLSLIILSFFIGCKNQNSENIEKAKTSHAESVVEYAEGFDIKNFGTHTEITIKTPWPDADKSFRYALIKADQKIKNRDDYDAVVQIPIKRIIVTSTTHIPSLEMLEETNSLIGFPDLDFISSKETRKRIDAGKIINVGQNEILNTEQIINLHPDVVVGFGMDGTNPSFPVIEKTRIPVLYNADWTETNPLGKAEWIKFFGALYDKQDKAEEIFKQIEKDYSDAKALASTATNNPTVISGAMYKDIWYAPQGNSWASKFITDAKGTYIWKESSGTGSLFLNIETVLNEGIDADIWIGPAQFVDFNSLAKANAAYTRFKAFRDKEVYTYSMRKGETGGSIYFELASNRPDLVLKDLIKIFHPELLPEYEFYFFDKLQ